MVIDFEGLSKGEIADEVSSGSRINAVVNGSVTVSGINSKFKAGSNAAMIFDATCEGGCSGDDDDLKKPGLGNILIINEDLDSEDPDDESEGGQLNFDFSDLGPGKVKVYKLDVLDAEDGGTVVLRSGGADGSIVDTVEIDEGADNGLATVETEAADVDFMTVKINGSGAVDRVWLKVVN